MLVLAQCKYGSEIRTLIPEGNKHRCSGWSVPLHLLAHLFCLVAFIPANPDSSAVAAVSWHEFQRPDEVGEGVFIISGIGLDEAEVIIGFGT